MKNEEKRVYLKRSYLFFSKFLFVGLIFLSFQLSASAQERTISGTVTGINNEPMIGVTVIVKGTNVGTLTNIEGKYSLPIPATAKILLFSFVGMDPKEMTIDSRNVYDVILSESVVRP